MSRAGARAHPGRRALDDLQQRAEGKRGTARLRPYGPGPGALYRCRRGRAPVRALGLPPTVTRAVALPALVVSGVPGPVATQGSQPLRKTDVIRLLSNPLISRSEVADLIRRNCVAFRPTPRDWADLRDFGADSEVLSSIGHCATTPAAQHAAPALPLSAVLLPTRLAVPVGSEAVARVPGRRGGPPPPGAPPGAGGASGIPRGAAAGAPGATDAGGGAGVPFPAGPAPAT